MKTFAAIGLVLISCLTAKTAGATEVYQEALRPQFHFTARTNWLNDPNGLVFYAGEYHLFFQHIPVYGVDGNQTWGHAVSPDLVHWRQLPHAIEPDLHGPIWSGSAVVDWHNTTGFATGKEKPLVAIYTSAGGISKESKGQPFAQSIAYSNDRGRTWTKYDHNPVLGQIVYGNRDPKVVWHEPSRKWIMILYKENNTFSLFSSPDLKPPWSHLQDIEMPGGAECPDFFEIPVEGRHGAKKWIVTSAIGNYAIGTFDGQKFTKETQPQRGDYGKNFYAVQTYSDIPKSDGRRIQMAWMRDGGYPNMPFNQQMTFPCELTLRPLPEGLRLFRNPVKEIVLLHQHEYSWKNQPLNPGENLLAGLTGDLFEIRADIEIGQATEVGFKLRGQPVRYSLIDRQLSCLGQSAPLDTISNNRLKLQILLDRASLEIFANDGRVSMSSCFVPDAKNRGLELYATNGPARVVNLQVYELKSAW